jgi:transcriptional regulator with XRE-family HTH domain
MSEEDPHPEGSLLRYLRRRKGWSQARLGAADGLSETEINHYELDRRRLRPKRLASLSGAMGYSDWEVRLYRLVVQGRPPAGAEDDEIRLAALPETEARLARAAASEHGLLAAQDFQGTLSETLAQSVVLALRREAERVFQAWERTPRTEQRLLVDGHPRFQTQALVEQICLASERAAAKGPKLPLHYAQLALRGAERLRASPKTQSRVQGYAWGFVGNARRVGAGRVGSGLREADEAFVQSDRLWSAGAGARGFFLEEWRLPDLRASLRRDQRRWLESLALSDQALSEAPLSARGRILVKKAAALEPMGEPEQALQALGEAAPLVEASGDRQVLLALRFNFAVNLIHVGRFAEAERRLATARRLALELGQDLHLNHCDWLAGRLAGELGRTAEAIAELTRAREDFTTRLMPLEAASVAMDETVYLLQAGDAHRVATLAEEVAWVFAAEGVREEALKALRVFYEAARAGRITLELARQLRDRFRRAA